MIVALDATRFHESKDFVKQPAKLYPVRIQHQHYQLRHFISTTEDGVVYHAHKNEIYALYTPSGRRERIATLDFTPVCFAAAYGWICAGSNNGQCAFIDVQGRMAEVDSLLPINLNSGLRDDGRRDSSFTTRTQWPHSTGVRLHQRTIGSDILNSITLYRMKSEDNDIISDEDIAVISTNEKAIHIYSLQRLEAIKIIEFPVQMNHASISPDGNLLVACGDKDEAFFCRRKRVPGLVVDREQTFASYDWEQFAHIRLPNPVQRDTCFSTAFSPSGHVCSIASQNGIVTVLEVSRIREGMDDSEAVIDHFTSSRPASVPEDMARWMPGAVRSSAFSPRPWDFFAWAEDRGRVCIADMRDGFRTRQLLELDPDAAGLQRCEITELGDSKPELDEREREATFLRRYRAAMHAGDARTSSIQNSADLIERSVERARRDIAGNWAVSSADLTGFDRDVPEARTERHASRRGNGADAESERPFRLNTNPGNTGASNQQTSAISQNQHMSVRQYIRDRSSTPNRDAASSASMRTLPPRRRSSVVLSSSRGAASSSQQSDGQEASSSSASHPSSLLPNTAAGAALSASPSRLGASAPSPTWTSEQFPASRDAGTEAWRTISAALMQATANETPSSIAEANRRSRLQTFSRHDRLLAEEQVALERRRRSRQRELQAGGSADNSRPPTDPASTDLYPGGDESYSTSSVRRSAYVGTSASDAAESDDIEITLMTPTSAMASNTLTPGIEDEDDDHESNEATAALATLAARAEQRERDATVASSAAAVQLQQQLLLQRLAASDAQARDATHRQHLESLIASNRRAVSRQDQALDQAQRGLEAIHSGQRRRLQERARLAEERIAADNRGSAAALGDLMRQAENLPEVRWARREREERSEYGVAVMGLGWSGDGRNLYVGTEDGIFEFQMDLGPRRFLPSITPR